MQKIQEKKGVGGRVVKRETKMAEKSVKNDEDGRGGKARKKYQRKEKKEGNDKTVRRWQIREVGH